MADEVAGRLPHDAAVPVANFAAGDDDGEVILGGEDAGHVEVVGDHAQLAVIEQGAGDGFGGGADVDEQRRAVGDVGGHFPGDALFLLELHHLAGAVGGVDGTRMQGGPAMVAPDLVLLGKIVEIPANGLGADVKMGHQILGRDKALPRQDVQDLQMSLGLLHA